MSESMPEIIKIVIVDDHPIFRHGLTSAIEKHTGMKVIGEAGDGRAALDMIAETRPDIVILDIDMPVMDGVETARRLMERGDPAKIIFLTMHKERSILRSLRSLGAGGYVLKDSAINEMVRCIESVLAGNTYLSPAINDLLLDTFTDDSDTLEIISTLTPSEKNVLSLITESKTNREIAEELFVSVRTIETHRYNICSKLKLNGTHALFKFAVQNKQKILDMISK